MRRPSGLSSRVPGCTIYKQYCRRTTRNRTVSSEVTRVQRATPRQTYDKKLDTPRNASKTREEKQKECHPKKARNQKKQSTGMAVYIQGPNHGTAGRAEVWKSWLLIGAQMLRSVEATSSLTPNHCLRIGGHAQQPIDDQPGENNIPTFSYLPLSQACVAAFEHQNCTARETMRLYPLPGRLEGVHDLGLPAPLLGVEVVLPPRRLRQGHEDGLNAAARL